MNQSDNSNSSEDDASLDDSDATASDTDSSSTLEEPLGMTGMAPETMWALMGVAEGEDGVG